MANYNKRISETCIRVGEVRFSFANVFAPRKTEDGSEGKYSVMILVPKTDKKGIELIESAIEAAKTAGKDSKWGGKIPAGSRLKLPLRDGDEEFPDDPTYEGMYFFNAASKASIAPKVGVRDDKGNTSEALDEEDFYSGCYGAAWINFYPYSVSGNNGVAAGLNMVVKTRDGEKLGGSSVSLDNAFADLDDEDF